MKTDTSEGGLDVRSVAEKTPNESFCSREVEILGADLSLNGEDPHWQPAEA